MEIQHKIITTVFLAVVVAASILALMNDLEQEKVKDLHKVTVVEMGKISNSILINMAKHCFEQAGVIQLERTLCYSVTIKNPGESVIDKETLENTNLDGKGEPDILFSPTDTQNVLLIYYNGPTGKIEIV